MKKIIIIPDTDTELSEKYPKQGRLSYTYLHGVLETDCGYDCYNIANPEEHGFKVKDNTFITPDKAMTGIYECTYNGKDCTLFLWVRKYFDKFGGLVVYNDDLEALEYAKECYENQEENL